MPRKGGRWGRTCVSPFFWKKGKKAGETRTGVFLHCGQPAEKMFWVSDWPYRGVGWIWEGTVLDWTIGRWRVKAPAAVRAEQFCCTSHTRALAYGILILVQQRKLSAGLPTTNPPPPPGKLCIISIALIYEARISD
ncbi:hypothetical protein HOY82DRAFT_583846 [Tuber indicum]|nr:hypothetical protein HOY82DRAFT_583846 [Tuber indicum]